MTVTYSTITKSCGETLALRITGKNADGDAYPIPDTWSVAAEVGTSRGIQPGIFDLEPVIVGGVVEISKSTATLDPRNYWFDIRLTDASGNHYYSAPIKLVIQPTNTALPAA